MSLQNMTFKHDSIEIEEEGGDHEHIVAMHETTNAAIFEVSLLTLALLS